jgi:hypothetical protein
MKITVDIFKYGLGMHLGVGCSCCGQFQPTGEIRNAWTGEVFYICPRCARVLYEFLGTRSLTEVDSFFKVTIEDSSRG